MVTRTWENTKICLMRLFNLDSLKKKWFQIYREQAWTLGAVRVAMNVMKASGTHRTVQNESSATGVEKVSYKIELTFGSSYS